MAATRDPYMQTEVYRFGNPIVDDWESKVNAWPLDEGLIDYVLPSYFGAAEHAAYKLDVIATPHFTLSGKDVDARTIPPPFCPMSCKRPTAARPMWQPAITRSNSCFGGKT